MRPRRCCSELGGVVLVLPRKVRDSIAISIRPKPSRLPSIIFTATPSNVACVNGLLIGIGPRPGTTWKIPYAGNSRDCHLFTVCRLGHSTERLGRWNTYGRLQAVRTGRASGTLLSVSYASATLPGVPGPSGLMPSPWARNATPRASRAPAQTTRALLEVGYKWDIVKAIALDSHAIMPQPSTVPPNGVTNFCSSA